MGIKIDSDICRNVAHQGSQDAQTEFVSLDEGGTATTMDSAASEGDNAVLVYHFH